MRVVLVVGASSGIGLATAKILRKSDTCVWTASSRINEDLNGRQLRLDLTDPASIRHGFTCILQKDGVLHGLVNTAGIVQDELIMQSHRQTWESVMNVNFWGAYELMRSAGRLLINAGEDTSIVNIASVSALHPRCGQGAYAASKAALLALTGVAAQEFARWNIRVNAIAPGYINTPMLASLSDAQRTVISQQTLAGCLGRPEDVAYVVEFLLSSQSRYITGATISVDGGLLTATPVVTTPPPHERSSDHHEH
ncbi:MAG: SDR family oxidoreductase [Firmicutes bacterium]|nr:SDR family oxidoreductase [Bacillota bacterium]